MFNLTSSLLLRDYGSGRTCIKIRRKQAGQSRTETHPGVRVSPQGPVKVDDIAPQICREVMLHLEVLTDVNKISDQGEAATLVNTENTRIGVNAQLGAGQVALRVGHRYCKTSY